MLQSYMFSQLARIKNLVQMVSKRSHLINPNSLGPMKNSVRSSRMERKWLRSMRKHWYCGGNRSLAVACSLLQDTKIIAIPTDTIYGLAGLAQGITSIAKLYEIKQREPGKALAICVCDVSDICTWAETKHLPPGLLEALLPGPVTVVLQRKPTLNPHLNPTFETVGIRVPDSPFLRSIIKTVGEPVALTSANESNKPNTLYPEEFQDLWPMLGGIFYPRRRAPDTSVRRLGSTIVDLTKKGYFKIVRLGRALHSTRLTIQSFGLEEADSPFKKERKKEKGVQDDVLQKQSLVE